MVGVNRSVCQKYDIAEVLEEKARTILHNNIEISPVASFVDHMHVKASISCDVSRLCEPLSISVSCQTTNSSHHSVVLSFAGAAVVGALELE